jgi:AraC family transcriptional activator of mtrCDE
MNELEVHFVKLAECLVSSGWRLALGATDALGMHYVLAGSGRMIVRNNPPIDLSPHTLVILPRRQPFILEVSAQHGTIKTVEGHGQIFESGALRRCVAGEGEPELMVICGYFNASFGGSLDPFATLQPPLVERFASADQLDRTLKCALAELLAQEVGMKAMTTTLLKQVLVKLLRISLKSPNLWVERFSVLGDPQIARAFADMVSQPCRSHSVQALSEKAGLSRSVFMARFTTAFGRSPMAVLRQLRMRHAAVLLTNDHLSIEQISHRAGYASRSSFFKAFQKAYGSDPSNYRARAHRHPDQHALR